MTYNGIALLFFVNIKVIKLTHFVLDPCKWLYEWAQWLILPRQRQSVGIVGKVEHPVQTLISCQLLWVFVCLTLPSTMKLQWGRKGQPKLKAMFRLNMFKWQNYCELKSELDSVQVMHPIQLLNQHGDTGWTCDPIQSYLIWFGEITRWKQLKSCGKWIFLLATTTFNYKYSSKVRRKCVSVEAWGSFTASEEVSTMIL